MTSLFRPFLLLAFLLSFASVTPALRAAEMSTKRRLDRLDALVQLSSVQRDQALAIFEKEEATLAQWPEGPERGAKGADARQQSRSAIRALLTPEQRKKYDVSPQSLGGGLITDPANIVLRLDQAVALTPEQKKRASDIIWADLRAQMAALPPDETLKGFLWRDDLRAELRALLTPEQQAKFEATPPFGKNAMRSGETRE